MFDAVICDWDGTLAETKRPIVISFQTALGEVGIDIDAEFVERRMGIGAAETFREILKNKNQPFTEALIKQLVNRKSQVQIELAEQVQMLPGAVELLDALKGKVKLGLASMNNRPVIANLVKVKKLEKVFDVVVTGDDVRNSKPDPEIFLKAAQELNVRPQRCVVLEDSIFGVKAAKSGGMGCVAVTTGVYGKAELQVALPDLVVESLLDGRIAQFILG